MRYKSFLFIFLLFLISYDDIIVVSSIDDIPGTWRWESTCGGSEDYTCVNASKSNYATIEFGSNGVYIEKHMDTVFMQTNYNILKSDDMFGTLILEDPAETRPVTILNGELIIQRAGFEDNYTKIKE